MTDTHLAEAQAHYEAGDFARSREAARLGLAEDPDDPALLREAARAGLELGAGDAVEPLERLVALEPHDARSWRDLGDALVDVGRLDDAAGALRRAVELAPGDAEALVDLGLTLIAAGRADEGLDALGRAVEAEPGHVAALRALAALHRRAGRQVDALQAARQLAEAQPDDPVAALELADLALAVGQLDEAAAALGRARELEDEPDHDALTLHALIEVEVRRAQWRRALDLAIAATRVDRLGRTTDLLAFVVGQVFGPGERPSPSLAEAEAALAASRQEHLRLHAEEQAVAP